MSGELPAELGHLELARSLGPALREVTRALLPAPGLVRALPPRGVKFLDGWTRALARTLEVAKDPALASQAFAIVEALPALDEVAFALRRSLRLAELGPALATAREAVGRALAGAPVAFLPDPAIPLGDVEALEASVRALAPGVSVQIELVPSFARAGRIVAVERRGLVEGGAVATVPLVHVASGEAAPPRLVLLEAALVALEAAAPTREDLARLVREIDRAERDTPEANGEAALRFAVGALERAGAVVEARAAALGFLEARGVSPVSLPRGTRFDPERHPPALFERRLGRGGEAGVVIATEATGFRDAQGVVLSRAVVVVAGG